MTNIRMVIGFVGATLLVCVAGILWLAGTGNTVPDILQNIASGALAGLIGLLVPAREAGRV